MLGELARERQRRAQIVARGARRQEHHVAVLGDFLREFVGEAARVGDDDAGLGFVLAQLLQELLKKLRKNEAQAGIVVADTRGLADDLAQEIAEDSDVVFLPTGASGDDLRPTLALARKLAKHGAEGRLVIVLSKVGRSEAQLQKAVEAVAAAGFELLPEYWPQRDGFQSDLDLGRAGREARNPYLREAAEKMEAALFARAQRAQRRRWRGAPAALTCRCMAAGCRPGSAERMTRLGAVIAEAIVIEYGRDEFLAGSPIPSGSSPSAP